MFYDSMMLKHRKYSLHISKYSFSHEGGETMEQRLSQQVVEFLSLKFKTSGCSTGQPGLADPTLRQLGQVMSRAATQPQ